MDTLTEILSSRAKTHGDYATHASCTQGIKRVIAQHTDTSRLTPSEHEALDMIAHKIGRIAAGDPHFEDHWRDIAGYATLVADRLKIDGTWLEDTR